ncbi:uncharacterized protein L3040_008283 [Drepanopeziza brunnea f. sp. 'multigermtubi']|uniref:uncharacterized protein n=1 Tax=Drepanopeziza brunnea f. sp. 'multigermtubi' TaxID=698441 RepID=UPI00238CB265|nr:hypothetical protein L3040_008283 [Drepanopeziza brunnea f. sp. 'multigermtubi']
MAIGDLKTRLRARFTRRHSTASSISQSSAEVPAPPASSTIATLTRSIRSRAARKTPSVTSLGSRVDEEEGVVVDREQKERQKERQKYKEEGVGDALAVVNRPDSIRPEPELELELELATRARIVSVALASSSAYAAPKSTSTSNSYNNNYNHTHTHDHRELLHLGDRDRDTDRKHDSSSTADFPTPNTDIHPVLEEDEDEDEAEDDGNRSPGDNKRSQFYFTTTGPRAIVSASASANMASRKIWVKRPAASATLVTIHEDDLVDDVRDMILKKYANSLGKNFDAPDVTLRIVTRDQRQERTLGPEEPMARTLDAYFPGGQTVDEALIIDVPVKRTPRPSPQPQRLYYDEIRPTEAGSDYFPPMPVAAVPSPHLQGNGHHTTLATNSMSVINTGTVPALPSPGTAQRRHHRPRPQIGRQTTSPSASGQQPGVNNGTQFLNTRTTRSRAHSSASEKSSAAPVAPPIPTPPAPTQPNDLVSQIQRVATPPPRVSSPLPPSNRLKKAKRTKVEHPILPTGLLDTRVPPINVLIVEDNIINLKLLEAFMKRLKVRWQTAMNGRDAVLKWRAGGFHLVLMDIQLPIMSGLEATKEIRRLERLNSIGVFSSSASSSAPETGADEPEGDDKLPSTVLFKSPVIIVALTASSLQSDRHEALTAGCNDFLTKPVNFVWLERKVMEWGCMQALIDFDGWRKWKDFSQQAADQDKEAKSAKLAAVGKKKKKKTSLGSNAGGPVATSTNRSAITEEGAESRES